LYFAPSIFGSFPFFNIKVVCDPNVHKTLVSPGHRDIIYLHILNSYQ
jgi:hypothetical protein